jgi:hypothetical protein
MVELAKITSSLILWASVYGVWIVVGMGSILTLVGIIRAKRSG